MYTHYSSQSSNSKSHLNGGGNKQISDRQINFIRTLCIERKLNIVVLLVKEYGQKELNELTGDEADTLIRKLLKLRYMEKNYRH
jgi:hypothetical protein